MDRLVNTYDQLTAAGGGVAISYHANGGRSVLPATWVVWRVDADGRQVKTDPKAQWYQHGNKWFTPFGETRAEALAKAKAWVAKQGWHAGEWRRNRFGDYVPAEIDRAYPLPKRTE